MNIVSGTKLEWLKSSFIINSLISRLALCFLQKIQAGSREYENTHIGRVSQIEINDKHFSLVYECSRYWLPCGKPQPESIPILCLTFLTEGWVSVFHIFINYLSLSCPRGTTSPWRKLFLSRHTWYSIPWNMYLSILLETIKIFVVKKRHYAIQSLELLA